MFDYRRDGVEGFDDQRASGCAIGRHSDTLLPLRSGRIAIVHDTMVPRRHGILSIPVRGGSALHHIRGRWNTREREYFTYISITRYFIEI